MVALLDLNCNLLRPINCSSLRQPGAGKAWRTDWHHRRAAGPTALPGPRPEGRCQRVTCGHDAVGRTQALAWGLWGCGRWACLAGHPRRLAAAVDAGAPTSAMVPLPCLLCTWLGTRDTLACWADPREGGQIASWPHGVKCCKVHRRGHRGAIGWCARIVLQQQPCPCLCCCPSRGLPGGERRRRRRREEQRQQRCCGCREPDHGAASWRQLVLRLRGSDWGGSPFRIWLLATWILRSKVRHARK